jgi:hypothetical protein
VLAKNKKKRLRRRVLHFLLSASERRSSPLKGEERSSKGPEGAAAGFNPLTKGVRLIKKKIFVR